MAAMGVPNVPSENIMKDIVDSLQETIGIKTIQYTSAFGIPYFINDIRGIIAQVRYFSLL